MTYTLGTEITHNGKTYLVVGVIDAQHLYEFAYPKGQRSQWERRDERYVCLRGVDGELEFITLSERATFLDVGSNMLALPRAPWRLREEAGK